MRIILSALSLCVLSACDPSFELEATEGMPRSDMSERMPGSDSMESYPSHNSAEAAGANESIISTDESDLSSNTGKTDDPWDICEERLGECNEADSTCLKALSECLEEQGENTTCLDIGVTCLGAGSPVDTCSDEVDTCFEGQASQIISDQSADQTQEIDTADATMSNGVDILAIGDSMLEWNMSDQGSIPEVAGAVSGMTVNNAAISGAQFLPEDGIPSQYTSGNYKVVIVNGGANDLNVGCTCGACMSQVDAIVDSQGQSGKMVSLIDTVTAMGARVVLLGYYQTLPGSEYDDCELERTALNTRYSAIGTSNNNVTYIDPSTVMTPTTTPEFYDDDKIHPSLAGSAAIGTLVGDAVSSF